MNIVVDETCLTPDVLGHLVWDRPARRLIWSSRSAGLTAYIWGPQVWRTVLGNPPNRSHPAFWFFMFFTLLLMLLNSTGAVFGIVVPLYYWSGNLLPEQRELARIYGRWLKAVSRPSGVPLKASNAQRVASEAVEEIRLLLGQVELTGDEQKFVQRTAHQFQELGYHLLISDATFRNLRPFAVSVALARLLSPLCPSCGYDLTGHVSGHCPECGTIIR